MDYIMETVGCKKPTETPVKAAHESNQSAMLGSERTGRGCWLRVKREYCSEVNDEELRKAGSRTLLFAKAMPSPAFRQRKINVKHV